jgi:hypothetical protein
MRISCWRETGALHEMLRDAEEGEMLRRAEANGIDPSLLFEEEISIDEYRTRFDPTEMEENRVAREAREKRGRLIAAVRWRVERCWDQQQLGVKPTESLELLLRYIQDLRDIPQQIGFPMDIIWPKEPQEAA